jgi:excisionase family DNA binding protein
VSENPIHNLLTVKETADYLRIPVPTVYYLAQRGQIPAIQIGGVIASKILALASS